MPAQAGIQPPGALLWDGKILDSRRGLLSAGVTFFRGNDHSLEIISSVAFTTAVTASPFFSARSSALCLSRPGPGPHHSLHGFSNRWISAWTSGSATVCLTQRAVSVLD